MPGPDAELASAAHELLHDLPHHPSLTGLRAALEPIAIAGPADESPRAYPDAAARLTRLEHRLGPAVASIGPDALGQRLTLPWEETLARGLVRRLVLDGAIGRAAGDVSRWRDDIEFWSATSPRIADEWALLFAHVGGSYRLPADTLARLKAAGRDAPFAPLIRGVSAARTPAAPTVAPLRVAPPSVPATTSHNTPAEATPPAPVLPAAIDAGVATPQPRAPALPLPAGLPRELAPAWAHLLEHGAIDATTLAALSPHARWTRLFAREVARWAASLGHTLGASAAGGARVWRLHRGPS